MKRLIYLMTIMACLSSYGTGHCLTKRPKPAGTSATQNADDREYSHACQSVKSGSYILGSATSPGWLNQEEAICRSQRMYPEYLDAAKVIPGNSAADEEMRRLYVMNSIWDNTPSLHTGVMSFNADNFIKNEPKDFAGLTFGTPIDDEFVASKTLNKKATPPVSKKRKGKGSPLDKDYLGNQKDSKSMYRISDYEPGYYFSTSNGDGSRTVKKVVLSSDPQLNEELAEWKGKETGFFSKLMSNKITPQEENIPKDVDVLGVALSAPMYRFDGNNNLEEIWGFLSIRKNLGAELSFQESSHLFSTLINRLGEPALKAKNDNYKFGIWLGKNGSRIDFLCREIDGQCVAGSVLVVQQSHAAGSETSGADFFK
jgi:hypothetical protein